MGPGSFGGFAIFLVVAVITGVIGYLARQQSKIKRQIEEDRRARERAELEALAGIAPGVTGAPPQIIPGTTPEITPSTTPIITPGLTPHHPHSPHDTGGHTLPDAGGPPGGFDGGGHSDGGHH